MSIILQDCGLETLISMLNDAIQHLTSFIVDPGILFLAVNHF